MINKVKFLFCISLLSILISSFIFSADEKLEWIDFATLQQKSIIQPRPILIDVYTDWCGWCKVMDAKTYKDKKLVAYLKAKYYTVKFNAESKMPVVFNGKTYKYDARNRVHELAIYLTYGRLEFPHTILLQDAAAQPAPFSGYLKPAQLEAPVKFFGEGQSDLQTFVSFNKTLKKEW